MKWREKLNLKTEEESWLTVLCCRRPNKVSCRNHSKTPGISMHIFPKDAKRKQKCTTFARIHRLACHRNTLPCAPSILKHRVSAEVCLLGHQWISRSFTSKSFSTINIWEAERFTEREMREDLQINFSQETFFGRFFGPSSFPTEKRQYPEPPPLQRNQFLSNWVGLFEICFRSSEMTDPRPCSRGWPILESRRVQRSMPSSNQQQIVNCKYRNMLGVKGTSQGKPPSQTSKGRLSGKNRFVLSLP